MIRLAKTSSGPNPRRRTVAVTKDSFCEGCGALLPCIKCARAYRAKSGQVGKEPTAVGLKAPASDARADIVVIVEEPEGFSPVVTAALAAIRKYGFVETTRSGRQVFHPAWDEHTERRRLGLLTDALEIDDDIYTPAPSL